MLEKLINDLKLPPFTTKEQMKEIMLNQVYGYLPERPDEISYKVSPINNETFCAGKAEGKKVEITVKMRGQEFTFPVYQAIPNGNGPFPFVVQINFQDHIYNKYTPVEEITDRGVAVLMLHYNDVCVDKNSFEDGLCKVLYPGGKRDSAEAGKIALWAWAASRVMDYAETVDRLDKNRSAVCGHSRLGKTALLCGATDERFKFVFSNDSGCAGAAITRNKAGETVENITNMFPYWFCENYLAYRGRENEMPFDQHYLTALIEPRYLYIASAAQDQWADPNHEFLNCYLTGKYYEQMGTGGFVCENRLPKIGDIYHAGTVGYHLRDYAHYFSREDWNKFLDFMLSK